MEALVFELLLRARLAVRQAMDREPARPPGGRPVKFPQMVRIRSHRSKLPVMIFRIHCGADAKPLSPTAPFFDINTTFYSERCPAERHIIEGTNALNWTRVRPAFARAAVKNQRKKPSL